jgi:hypothetical protein
MPGIRFLRMVCFWKTYCTTDFFICCTERFVTLFAKQKDAPNRLLIVSLTPNFVRGYIDVTPTGSGIAVGIACVGYCPIL